MSRIINTPEVAKTLTQLSRHCGRQARLYLKFSKEDGPKTKLGKQWARDARSAFNYSDCCAIAAEIVGQQPRCVTIAELSAAAVKGGRA